jgi:hypothetical protein
MMPENSPVLSTLDKSMNIHGLACFYWFIPHKINMSKKGIMPKWTLAILGFLFLVAGAYMAITFFAVSAFFWTGVILLIIGLVMIFITAVLP